MSAITPTGRDPMVLHHFASTGEHLSELMGLSGMRRYEFAGVTGPDPLSPRAIVRVQGESVFIAETTVPRIRVIHPSTGTREVIEWDGALTRFEGNVEGRAMEAAIERADSDEERDRVEERFDALSGDEPASEFRDFLVDELGFIWVRPFDPAVHGPDTGGMGGPGPGGTWVVLSPDGEPLTQVDLPADLEPTSITSDAVLGIRRDALGVESVRVHPIDRVGGG